MNTFNEIKQLLSSTEEFYGVVEKVESERIFISSIKGGHWYSGTGFKIGDKVRIHNNQIELSIEITEGNIFQV